MISGPTSGCNTTNTHATYKASGAEACHKHREQDSGNLPSIPDESLSWQFQDFPPTWPHVTKGTWKDKVEVQRQRKNAAYQSRYICTSRIFEDQSPRQYKHQTCQNLAAARFSPLENEKTLPAHNSAHQATCCHGHFSFSRLHTGSGRAKSRNRSNICFQSDLWKVPAVL